MNRRYMALASTILLLSPFAGATLTYADTLNELEQENNQLEQESKEVESQLHETHNHLHEMELEKEDLEQNITTLQSSIDELLIQLEEQEEKLDEIATKIVDLEEEITNLASLIAQRNEKLNTQARVIQTEASMDSLISFVANADSLTDMIAKIATVNRLVTANKEIVTQQEADKLAIEEAKQAIEEEKIAQEAVKQEIIISKNNIVAQQNELSTQVALIIENIDVTAEEKAKLEEQQSSLASKTESIQKDIAAETKRLEEERIAREKAEAERLAKEEAERIRIANELAAKQKAEEEAEASSVAEADDTSGKDVASADGSPSSSLPQESNGSGFIRPASGYNTDQYGMRINPVDGGYRMHNGMDIAGSGPVVAAQSGVVTEAGFDATYGYYVVVDHGSIDGVNVKSKYAHMIPGLFVAPGQSVSQGQQLGIMGTTGQSTGVHLHFEIFENGSHVNPANYIGY